MVTYQTEAYSNCIDELKTIYPEHYEELSVTKSFELEPDYEQYLRLESVGVLKVVTCRNDGELIGYIMYIISPHLHYKSCLTAFEDIYFVKKQYRKGRIGIKLFKYAEEVLRELKVNRVIYATKVHLDNSKLFEYLGYTNSDKLYTKLL
jgi:GNAT superfamily N-acetyltransferase